MDTRHGETCQVWIGRVDAPFVPLRGASRSTGEDGCGAGYGIKLDTNDRESSNLFTQPVRFKPFKE
jgi:hypothetical protein